MCALCSVWSEKRWRRRESDFSGREGVAVRDSHIHVLSGDVAGVQVAMETESDSSAGEENHSSPH